MRLLLELLGRERPQRAGVTVVITQEAAQKRIELMERLARAYVELHAVAGALDDLDERILARRIGDCASLVAVTKMQLREQVGE